MGREKSAVHVAAKLCEHLNHQKADHEPARELFRSTDARASRRPIANFALRNRELEILQQLR
ncbi:MAG: hypothetical protein DMG00_23030, partial [Acidobacteria bacterium]